MSSLLKDLYSPVFYERFANTLTSVIPNFDSEAFVRKIFDSSFETKELKERMKHTSRVLHQFLPNDFAKAVEIIKDIITQLRQQSFTGASIEFMFFPDYIETYGLDDFESAVKAIEFVTQFTSCEFAVRPFILKYGDSMIKQMTAWSLHENYKVRRLASEGTRPRLPWAIALPQLKKDPGPILPLLENLKDDPSEWVRRSVANNLNDIAKDNPDVIIEIAKKWVGISKEVDAVVKHGCRTLLKQGHTEVLRFYGLQSEQVVVADFQVLTPLVRMGEQLSFSFLLRNGNQQKQVVRVEYAIYYKKKNGLLSKKVFKISERVYMEKEQATIRRNHSFKRITTRTFYVGLHKLSLIINGEEKLIKEFELTN